MASAIDIHGISSLFCYTFSDRCESVIRRSWHALSDTKTRGIPVSTGDAFTIEQMPGTPSAIDHLDTNHPRLCGT